jgi:hypothetical protein
MTQTEIVQVVADSWRAWQDEPGFPFTPDHCINGARVAMRTLHTFGVKAKPMSVRFTLFNRFAKDLFDAGFGPDEWPDHAWSLGVGPDAQKGDGGGWDGHLMLEGDGWTLDVSARQFHRPGLIRVERPLLLWENLPGWPRLINFTDEHSQWWTLGRWPSNNGWRNAPGWFRLHEAEMAELTDRMKRRLPA